MAGKSREWQESQENGRKVTRMAGKSPGWRKVARVDEKFKGMAEQESNSLLTIAAGQYAFNFLLENQKRFRDDACYADNIILNARNRWKQNG